MISRSIKVVYFATLHYPMRFNAFRHRLFPRRRGTLKVHLGPGQMNYLDGWINVDANFVTAKIDLWADLGDKFPFTDGTVDAFYSHHVIEHLADAKLPRHFGEMFRCLKNGGVIRVGGPNGDVAIDRFISGDSKWFSNFPDNRRSIGGRFANYILCRGEHLTILTASYLEELAGDAGFREISFCKPVVETRVPKVFDDQVMSKEWESTPEFPHTLIMEARKPL